MPRVPSATAVLFASDRQLGARPPHLLRADGRKHPRRITDLGDQHDLSARRRPDEPGGLCRQRLLHRRNGDLRNPDRYRRRHLGPPHLLPLRSADAGAHNRAVRPALAMAFAVRLVGDRIRVVGARIHLFLRCDRGLAGRCADRDEVRRCPGVRSVPRASDLGHRVACWVGGWWLPGAAHQSRRALRRTGCHPGRVFFVALLVMHDLGFTPQRANGLISEIKQISRSSLDNGLRVPPIRATMLSALFTGGVGIYVFYALQPYLLELWGDPRAYGIAGLAAAIVAGAQIVGGLLVPRVRRLYRRRTSALLVLQTINIAMLVLIGLIGSFWVVIALIVVWQLAATASLPIRQVYLNGMIPSEQRATILSFDSLMSSAGGIVIQPALGRAADVWNYAVSYLFSAAISACALPFLFRARQLAAPADTASSPTDRPQAQPSK